MSQEKDSVEWSSRERQEGGLAGTVPMGEREVKLGFRRPSLLALENIEKTE